MSQTDINSWKIKVATTERTATWYAGVTPKKPVADLNSRNCWWLVIYWKILHVEREIILTQYQRASVSLSKAVQFSTFLFESDKLRKATVSFVMFVRLSVRTEQLGPHWKDILKFGICGFLKYLSRKLKFNKNLTVISVIYVTTNTHIWSYLAQVFFSLSEKFHYEKCFRQTLQIKPKCTFYNQ
jgi:hypothetical protein